MYVRIPAQRNGLSGFATAIKSGIEKAKARQAATVTAAPIPTVTPQYAYITTSGFAKRPIAINGGNVVGSGPKYSQPISPIYSDPRAMPPIDYLPELTRRLTTEELTRLRDQELLAPQSKEGGTINADLEAKAAQNDAVSRAVESGGGGTVILPGAKTDKNYLPLIIAAAMAYFLA